MKTQIKDNIREMGEVLKKTVAAWSEDKVPRLAAALSYYTIFSIAPLMLIVIAIAGIVFGVDNVRTQIIDQLKTLLGNDGTQFITSAIRSDATKNSNIIASIIGFATLLLGAAGVFGQLKTAFNEIWHIEPQKGQGIFHTIKANFLSFSMVIGIGFLLLVSLVISAGVTALGVFFHNILPFSATFIQVLNTLISFFIIMILFAAMFKVLPDKKIPWNDVWRGAFFTAFLFSLGKVGIGWYLGYSAAVSKYGTAGSLVVILLWIYYSSQILFFGAEFTKVYSYYRGSNCPKEKEKVSDASRITGSFLDGFMKGIFKQAKISDSNLKT